MTAPTVTGEAIRTLNDRLRQQGLGGRSILSSPMVQLPPTPPKPQPQAHAGDKAAEPFGSRVLVETPVTRWIPIFALGVEKGRDEVESTVLTSARALRHVAGAKAASALRSDRYGAYQLVHCRCRTGPRTATYSTWLHFADAEHARAFVMDYPDVAKAVS